MLTVVFMLRLSNIRKIFGKEMRLLLTLIMCLGMSACDGNITQPEASKKKSISPASRQEPRKSSRKITLDSLHAYMRVRADAQDTQAQEILGSMALFGVSMPRDDDVAEHYLQSAAQKKSAEANYLLGVLYKKTNFPKKDNARSQQFFQKACEGGHHSACKAVKRQPTQTRRAQKKSVGHNEPPLGGLA